MKVRLRRSLPPEESEGAAATASPAASEQPARRVSQRGFLKLVGVAVGVGLASPVVTPAIPAQAQTIGDPADLQGRLQGPTNAALTMVGRIQSSSVVSAARILIQKPNGSGGYTADVEALIVRNTGDVLLPAGNLNLAGGFVTSYQVETQRLGGTTVTGTLDMGNQTISNVYAIWSFPNSPLRVTGWSGLDVNKGNGSGPLTWFGGTWAPLITMDTQGKLLFGGAGVIQIGATKIADSGGCYYAS